jgi:hypothetical protein
MSYINVVERPGAQSDSLDLKDIYGQWSVTEGAVSKSHREVTLSDSYQVDEVELTYTLQPALRLKDQQAVFQFTLTAGSSRSVGADVDAALMDKLHNVLLAAFEEFTSDRAKRVWERYQ